MVRQFLVSFVAAETSEFALASSLPIARITLSHPPWLKVARSKTVFSEEAVAPLKEYRHRSAAFSSANCPICSSPTMARDVGPPGSYAFEDLKLLLRSCRCNFWGVAATERILFLALDGASVAEADGDGSGGGMLRFRGD